PATSPPQTPAQSPTDEVKVRPIAESQAQAQDHHHHHHHLAVEEDADKCLPGSRDELLYPLGEKKHSLADTIDTSVTTPISLKTLINDVDVEELLEDQHLSAADIAAASLASGLRARRAEPETLSDASVSPTAVVQTQTQIQSQSQNPLIITTTASNSSNNLLSQVTALYGNPSPNNPNSNPSSNPNPNTNPNPGQSSNPNPTQQRCSCQPQTSPLPHIEEEEESEQANSKQLAAGQSVVLQPEEFLEPQVPPITIAGGYCGSCESVHHSSGTSSSAGPVSSGGNQPAQEYIPAGTSSTPSPRIKLKFRKPHKSCWSRIVLAPIGSTGGSSSLASTVIGSNSNETLASSGTGTGTGAGTGTQNSSSVSVAAHHRLTSSSASALASSHPSGSATQLLPTGKMQAEQGSIGDLQKYHSRYLKNRRHTLANVR
ncbi:hypothetical protein KR009_009834, partial [Drosophila setifemur]